MRDPPAALQWRLMLVPLFRLLESSACPHSGCKARGPRHTAAPWRFWPVALTGRGVGGGCYTAEREECFCSGMTFCNASTAGAVEAAFTVLALRDSAAPATLNLDRPIAGPWKDALIRKQPCKLLPGQKMAMSNSFGFGGVNASLLFASPPIYEDPVVDGTP